MAPRFLSALLALGLFMSAPASADTTLGIARVFNNDYLGDGGDKWRTGSYHVGLIRGSGWSGERPTSFGQLREWRFRGEIITPKNTMDPAPDDRLHAGTLSFGLHSYVQRGGWEIDAGADMVWIGPQTGLLNLQQTLHEIFGLNDLELDDWQTTDKFRPTARLEVGRGVNVGVGELRPFAEMQGGLETYARVGADYTVGEIGLGELMVRDVVTGHRVAGIENADNQGFSFTVGGDVAHVADSAYIAGRDLEETRYRVRAGLRGNVGPAQIFYGATYLSEEFAAQPEGQTVGTLSIRLSF